jgi:hypothetical protein
VAVSLHDHLQILVAEQVGDLAERYVGVDHQRRNGVAHLVQRQGGHPGARADPLESRRACDGSTGVPTSDVNTRSVQRGSVVQ